MKPSPSAIEFLAAQYALGLLQDATRRRLERLMMEDYRIRQEVWFWERELNSLVEHITPVKPPVGNWQRIEERLWPNPAARAGGTRLWRWWSGVSTALLLLLVVLLPFLQQQVQPTPDNRWLAVVQTNEARPLWVIDTDSSALHLRAVGADSPGASSDYELWLLPETGVPVSIGLLPTGGASVTLHLSDEQLQRLLRSRSLAISLEPSGGSPTGLPTGPVLYQAELLKL